MPKFEVYADEGGRFRWRYRADNGDIVAGSGESFHSKWNAIRAVDAFIRAAGGWTLGAPWEVGDAGIETRTIDQDAEGVRGVATPGPVEDAGRENLERDGAQAATKAT